VAVVSLIDLLVGNDQVVLGVDGDLSIVADGDGALAAGRHRSGIGVGQRDLPVGASCTVCSITFKACICGRRPAIFSFSRIDLASAISLASGPPGPTRPQVRRYAGVDRASSPPPAGGGVP
jgi:hypothetical protein